MLFKPVIIYIDSQGFDIFFTEFMYENWATANWDQNIIRGVKLRHEIYLQDQELRLNFLAEIERSRLSTSKVEIKVAAINISVPYANLFLSSFDNFLNEKWKVSIFQFVNTDNFLGEIPLFSFELSRTIDNFGVTDKNLMMNTGRIYLPGDHPRKIITVEEKLLLPVDDPQQQWRRKRLLEALQQRLPPKDIYNRKQEPKSRSTVPQRDKQRHKWEEAYKKILEIQEDYTDRYSSTDIYSPSLEDLCDALVDIFKKRPSTKTVQKIIEAGDNGLLG